MGSDPAPFMANLFLYFYERKWVLNTKKSNLRKARLFGNTFRFIDDLIAINDVGLFESSFKEIYPVELELKKENIGTTSATFLDLDISIIENKFDVKLYDKRDAFPFSIVRMPFLDSNMPSKIFYSSLGAEVLRIARTTNNKAAFLNSVSIIIKRMVNQGAKLETVIKTLKKVFGQHFTLFEKYAPTTIAFINLLINNA